MFDGHTKCPNKPITLQNLAAIMNTLVFTKLLSCIVPEPIHYTVYSILYIVSIHILAVKQEARGNPRADNSFVQYCNTVILYKTVLSLFNFKTQ